MREARPRVAVWIDGVAASEDPRISVFDRGFLYGDSVFETLRTYGGQPFALGQHLSRLESSAGRVDIAWSDTFRSSLAAEVRAAVQELGGAESYVRVMVTRGEGCLGLIPSPELAPRRVILVAPLSAPTDEFYREGASAISFQVEPRFGLRELAGAKIGNYLIGVLALRRAREARAEEALLTDARGVVSEGATSNLFFVRGGVLCTPGDDQGILSGITRRAVLSQAERLGMPISYEMPELDALVCCDEVFVTSTIREVVPIVRVDGKIIAGGAPGPVTLKLLSAFRRHAREASIREAEGLDLSPS